MTLDARQLKLKYKDDWPISNARELYVLGMLNTILYPKYRAVLTGLGAGSSELIEDSYHDLMDAFDIAIVDSEGRTVVLIEVTGTRRYKRLGCDVGGKNRHLKCVGSWKLNKARKYRVEFAVWSVFITPSARDRWIHYERLAKDLNAPFVRRCRLEQDEREVYCTPPEYWVKRESFLSWLHSYANLSRSILERALRKAGVK